MKQLENEMPNMSFFFNFEVCISRFHHECWIMFDSEVIRDTRYDSGGALSLCDVGVKPPPSHSFQEKQVREREGGNLVGSGFGFILIIITEVVSEGWRKLLTLRNSL